MEIRVDRLTKAFDRLPALNNVSLQVRSGELMALLGPSGSGKTTLLRCIAGLEVPSAGQILFGSEDATNIPVQKRGVGFVFQHYALFKHMTVADNIGYGLRVRPRSLRPPQAEIAGRIDELLELVQLGGYGRRYPGQLSGGQRQRVALARALAVEPRVLLLDEPFGALDAKVRKDLRRWLREIHEQTGRTTIFVTHDQEEALEVADRIAILRDGRIEQVGTPDEIHEEPASPFVMSFIGDTSNLPTDIRDGAAWFGGTRLGIDASAAANGPARLFLRPWHVRIATGAGPGIEGLVTALRRTASGRRAEVRVDADALLDIEVPSDLALTSGESVRLEIIGGRLYPAE